MSPLDEECPERGIIASAEGVQNALMLVRQYGGIDGAHHKDWVLDQVVRSLTGDLYDEFVRLCCLGEDGPDTYEWSEGIPP